MSTTIAVLAADIVGYSRLTSEAEEQTLLRLKDLSAAVNELIERHNGRVFTTAGDGFKAVFTTPFDALAAAWALQRLTRSRNAGVVLREQMLYRVGIADGSESDISGQADGPCVIAAAGLEAMSPPGGICLTARVHAAVVGEKLWRFEDLGALNLRGVKGDTHVFAVMQTVGTVEVEPSNGPRKASAVQGRWGEMKLALGLVAIVASLAGGFWVALQWLVPANTVATGSRTVAQVAVPASTPVIGTPFPRPPPPVLPTITPPVTPALSDKLPQDDPVVASAADPGVVIIPRPEAAQAAPSLILPSPRGTFPPVVAAPAVGPDAQAQMDACLAVDRAAALAACRALVDLKDLGSLTAKRHEIMVRIGNLLREAGRLDEALLALQEAVTLQPNATGFIQIGTLYYQRNQLPDALAAFTAAIQAAPADGEGYNNRAWILFRQGKLQEAVGDIKLALLHSPDKAYVWDTSGHIHEALGERALAIQHFRNALKLDSASATSRTALVRLGIAPPP